MSCGFRMLLHYSNNNIKIFTVNIYNFTFWDFWDFWMNAIEHCLKMLMEMDSPYQIEGKLFILYCKANFWKHFWNCNKLAVIVILWILLCKTLFFNCLTILNGTLPKNIDENGFHIPKLRENSSFYTSNKLLEAFLKLHKLTLIVVLLILLCKTLFSIVWQSGIDHCPTVKEMDSLHTNIEWNTSFQKDCLKQFWNCIQVGSNSCIMEHCFIFVWPPCIEHCLKMLMEMDSPYPNIGRTLCSIF